MRWNHNARFEPKALRIPSGPLKLDSKSSLPQNQVEIPATAIPIPLASTRSIVIWKVQSIVAADKHLRF